MLKISESNEHHNEYNRGKNIIEYHFSHELSNHICWLRQKLEFNMVLNVSRENK